MAKKTRRKFSSSESRFEINAKNCIRITLHLEALFFFKIRPEKQHCVLWTLYILYINAYTACWGYMQFRIFIIKKFTNPKLLWDVIWSNDILGHTLWGFANISNSKMYVAYMQYFLSMILIIYIMNWAIMQVAFMHLIKKMQTVKIF